MDPPTVLGLSTVKHAVFRRIHEHIAAPVISLNNNITSHYPCIIIVDKIFNFMNKYTFIHSLLARLSTRSYPLASKHLTIPFKNTQATEDKF